MMTKQDTHKITVLICHAMGTLLDDDVIYYNIMENKRSTSFVD